MNSSSKSYLTNEVLRKQFSDRHPARSRFDIVNHAITYAERMIWSGRLRNENPEDRNITLFIVDRFLSGDDELPEEVTAVRTPPQHYTSYPSTSEETSASPSAQSEAPAKARSSSRSSNRASDANHSGGERSEARRSDSRRSEGKKPKSREKKLVRT